MVNIKEFDPTVLGRSIRASGIDGGGDGMGALLMQFATVADEIPPWGVSPRRRDRELRAFVTKEAWLLSALYAICARNAAFSYKLNGPERTVAKAMDLLKNANFGKGWAHFIAQLSFDLLTQDNGAFIEVVRSGQGMGDPVLGIAHLDAGRCTRTSDDEYPIVYEDRHGVQHKLGWWQVIPVVEMPSPIEEMNGTGYCAVTRVLRAAQILRDLAVYKNEKIGGRFNRAIHLVSGPRTSEIRDALDIQKNRADDMGLLRYMEPLIIGSLDPTRPVSVATIEMASLPEGFNEETTLKWYIAILALGLGADYQDLAPLPGGNLGTSAQSEVLARKSSGKGPALFQKIVSHLLNWEGILPKTVEFVFEEEDLEAEEQQARVRKLRAEARKLDVESGTISPQVAAQIALEVGDITQEQLELMGAEDVIPEISEPDEGRPGAETETTVHEEEKTLLGRGKEVFPGRMKLEREFADAVEAGLKKVGKRVRDVILKFKAIVLKAGPGDLESEGFWKAAGADFLESASPAVRQVVLQGALSGGVQADFDLLALDTLRITREYTNPWWEGIEMRTREGLREAIVTWQETGLGTRGLPDLVDAISPLFGRMRAERIAVTEVTSLFAQGKFASMRLNPLVERWEWRTAGDAHVDPVCRANAGGGPYAIGQGPSFPAHVNCRCWPVESIA